MESASKRRKLWTEDEETIFINIWEDKIVDLLGPRKNSHVYKEMSSEFDNYGYSFEPREIKYKIHNFTMKYKKEKQAMDASGATDSSWRHYEQINRLIGANNVDKVLSWSIQEVSEDIPSRSPSSLDDTLTDEVNYENKLVDEMTKVNATLECIARDNKIVNEKMSKMEKENVEIMRDIRDDMRRLTDGILKCMEKM